MLIRFGNLTVRELADMVAADLTDAEVAQLESYRTDHAVFSAPDKFHIFNDPALVVVLGADAIAPVIAIFQTAHERRPFAGRIDFLPNH